MFFNYAFSLWIIAICLKASLASQCGCSKIADPVCGSDGRTYSNNCMLECSRSIDPKLTLTSKGSCEREKDNDDNQYILDDINSPEMADSGCSQGDEPVCGSDGVTYDNICLLNCAKNSIPMLELFKAGPCDEDGSDARARAASCACLFDMRSQDELSLIECLMGPGGCLRRKTHKPNNPYKPYKPNRP